MSESGLWAVFGALATVQIMESGMCGRDVAATALQQVSQDYVGRELTTDDMTTIILRAVEKVRHDNPYLIGGGS